MNKQIEEMARDFCENCIDRADCEPESEVCTRAYVEAEKLLAKASDMPRYIDADALLSRLPDDLPYKGSVKRVLLQAPTADVAPIADTAQEMQTRLAMLFGTYTDDLYVKVADLFKMLSRIAEEILAKGLANGFLSQSVRQSTDVCVSCGAVIPEGRQVCPNCEREENDNEG